MVYKSRKFVCTECQRHRRRCTLSSKGLQGRCLRCERLDRVCVPSADQNEYYNVNSLEAQIDELKIAIHEMELQMRNLGHSGNDKRAMICQSSNSNNIKFMAPTTELQNHLLQNLMFQWQIQIKNGTFQIETGIRNVGDLLRFKPNISYLSPLSSNSSVSSGSSSSTDSSSRGSESSLIMRFGTQSGSLVPFTIKLLTQCAKKQQQELVTQQLPRNLLMFSRAVMDQLINIYFSCHNIYSPMIHQNSYMEKYLQLLDPMTDLLSLCICCHVCSNPCNHNFFTSTERRSLADYFYAKAKSIILDQFDLPEKRLENVMGINLFIKYMHATLKIKECRKLIMMAYQICADLKDDFKESSSDTNQSGGMDLLDRVLYSRHVTLALRMRKTMDFISSEFIDDSWFSYPRWGYMDDEPEETRKYVLSQNWLLGLYNHPFIKAFMGKVFRIHLGLVGETSFESIILLEDVTAEWNASIPAEYRLCDDLKDMDLCKAAIDKTTDCVLLMTFIHFHSFLVGIYTCLLQPIALGADNDQLLSVVQQRSLENTLKGCRLIIYAAVTRISETARTTSCHYTQAASYFLFHAIDVLMALSLSPNVHLAKEARIVMKACLNEIDPIEFMQEHYVPPNVSPIFLGMMRVNDASDFNIEYYNQYPQPWFAMTYDSCRYIASSK